MKIKNVATCTNCNDNLESKHVHDFVCCSCRTKYNEAASKFRDNVIKGFKELGAFGEELIDDWRVLYVIMSSLAEHFGTGIFIDGGQEYQRGGGNMHHFKQNII